MITSELFISGLSVVSNNWYNNIVLFIWFDFYFQKKRWITKVFIKYLRLRSLYLFFCNDGWGKRLFVVRYEASEVFTISILFLSFYSGTMVYCDDFCKKKSRDESNNRNSDSYFQQKWACLSALFLLQWLLMMFLPQLEHNDVIFSFIFESYRFPIDSIPLPATLNVRIFLMVVHSCRIFC